MRKILLCAVVGLIPGFALAAGAANPPIDTKATVKTEATVNTDAAKTVMPAKVEDATKTAAAPVKAASTKAHRVVHKAVNKAKTTTAPKTDSKS